MQTNLAPARARLAKKMFLLAAFASLVLSVTLYFILGDTRAGIFVGLWVPSILSFGVLTLIGEETR